MELVLSFDILCEVMLDCSIDDLLNLALTCHKFHNIICNDTFWQRKYRHDFKIEIKQDKISQCLKLTPRQAYVRKYTQEGGVTYGSVFFQDLSRLLPRAIRSGNWEMIDYHLDYLDDLIKYYKYHKKDVLSYNDLIDWEEAVREALWMGSPELGQEIMKRAKTGYRQSINTFRSYWNGNLLLKGALDSKVGYSTIDLRSIIYLEGALLNQNYHLADQIIKDFIRYKEIITPVSVAFSIQEYEWIDQYINLYPDLFTKKILARAHIQAAVPNINVDAIFNTLTSSEVLDTMICSRVYYPQLFKRALSEMKEEDFTNYHRFGIPCHQEILPLILEKFPSWGKFIHDLSMATPEIYDTYQDQEAYSKVLWNAVEAENYDLVVHLIDKMPLGMEELSEISGKILDHGYKDLWAYMMSKIDLNELHTTKHFYSYLDMKKFEKDFFAHPNEPYTKISSSFLKR